MKIDPVHQMTQSAAARAPVSHGIFAAAVVAELAEAIPAAQRHGFYQAVGRRMAATELLEGVNDVSQLGWRVNAFWGAIGWGEADLAIERDHIVVRHRDLPAAAEGASADMWQDMLLSALEGAYDAWFRRLGSGPTLRTWAEWAGDTLELRHGR